MKLSEAPVKSLCRWDRLFILRVSITEYIFVLPGDKIKKGEPPIDLSVENTTKEDFLSALDKVDHKGDWYSMLLAEMAREELKSL